MNNIEELNTEYLKINARSAANGVAAISSKWAGETMLAQIAQLEATQKEMGVYSAISEDVGAIVTLLQGNEWAEHVAKTNVGGAFEQEITRLINSITDLRDRAQTAEAALSAANEKLKGEQVPVAVIVLSKNWPDTGRKVIDYYIEKIQHLPVGTELFTAPQKPVVLPEAYAVRAGHPINEGERNVMIPKQDGNWLSRFDVEHAIRAAGFTVKEDATPIVIVPAPAGVIMRPPFKKPLEHCAAARDGECSHQDCPQLRDNEPMATGRHCPIDDWDD